MQTVGAYLRELRTARGVSLEELARTTRVGQGYLRALEADDFNQLPAPVFTKGFIRAYCLALGEPADEGLSRYRELSVSAPADPALTLTLRPKAPGRGPVLVSLVLLLALGLGLFLLTLGLQGRFKGPSSAQRATPAAVKSPTAPVKAPAEREPARARLVARAIEPTWVRVQMDDGSVVQELLPAGATREWVSNRRFVLTVGNAGGLALELNGKPIPPLGARGAVIQNLVIPAETEAARP
jgi:transcriptional regulator with XRE-family HTH domain